MSRRPNELKKRSGADLRAAAAARQQEADPAFEANRREASFLANLSRAQTDFEWIAENQAWTLLGHDSLAEWWAAKVQPVMSALSMRLSPEMATKVIEKVKAAEAQLPASQRRSARELAELVGTSEWTARGRQDRDKRRGAAVADLEGTATDPLDAVPAAQNAIAEALANRSAPAEQPEEDHQEGKPGDEDGAAKPSDPAEGEVPVVPAEPSRDETEADDDASQQSSAEVAERQPESPGVSSPAAAPQRSGGNEERGRAAAPASAPPSADKARRSEALTKWALDTPEGRALAKRALVNDWMSGTWEFLDEVGPDVFVEVADAGMHEDMDRLLAAVTGWAAAKKANSGIRLVKGA